MDAVGSSSQSSTDNSKRGIKLLYDDICNDVEFEADLQKLYMDTVKALSSGDMERVYSIGNQAEVKHNKRTVNTIDKLQNRHCRL